jgi:hypothetical protein
VRLSQIRPDEVVRAGALLGMTADSIELASAISARSSTVVWHGPPQLAFQHRLGDLVHDLTAVRRAFADAGDAVLAYGRCLDGVQGQAQKSEALTDQADRLHLREAILGGTSVAVSPEVARLRAQAEALLFDAEQAHAGAAARLVLALRELADRAPREGRGTQADRALGHVASAVGSAVKFPFVLGKDAVVAVGGDPDPLVEDLTALNPWTFAESLVAEIRQHEWSHLTGESLAIVLMRNHGGAMPEPLRRYGAHDHLPLSVLDKVLRGRIPGENLAEMEAWIAQHGQAVFLAQMEKLTKEPLLKLDGLLTEPVDLMLHDAHGGHTLLRHVGRDRVFLLERQHWNLLDRVGRGPMSSFHTIADAERVVTAALQSIKVGDQVYASIEAWLVNPRKNLALTFPLVGRSGAVLIDKRGVLKDPTRVSVRLAVDELGRIYIDSAFVK